MNPTDFRQWLAASGREERLRVGFPLFLAPMARYTDFAFRQLCKEQGADVMTTEFVMAEGLLRSQSAWGLLDFSPEQRPMGVQIFGSEAPRMALAAEKIVERLAPDFVDINCGCPAHRVTDINAGSSLLKDPALLAKIVAAVVKAAAPTPVTVKIRLGWDAQSIVAEEIGLRVQEAGARLLAIHGRTKEQGYRGDADWDAINSVAGALAIPVIGNGGITRAQQVEQLRDGALVAGIMIGRAAQGYPWLFKEIKHYLQSGEHLPAPAIGERWQTILRFTELLYSGPYRERARTDVGWLRAKIKALTKDMPGARRLRPALDAMTHVDDLQRIAATHKAEHADAEPPAQGADNIETPEHQRGHAGAGLSAQDAF